MKFAIVVFDNEWGVQVMGETPLLGHILSTAEKVQKVLVREGHTVSLGLLSNVPFSKSYVKTNHENVEIIEIPDIFGEEDTTPDELAGLVAYNYPDFDALVQLTPSSPFLSSSTIVDSITDFANDLFDHSAVGVTVEIGYFWFAGVCNFIDKDSRMIKRHEIPPIVKESEGLYITRIPFILQNEIRHARGNTNIISLSVLEAFHIAYEEDLELARTIYKGLDKS